MCNSSMIEYKYDPASFLGVLGLSDELAAFYKMHKDYAANQTREGRLFLEKQARDLFFTLKHRRIEGAITQTTANEILEYLEELLRD